jgi:hypothetical protein
MISTGATAAHSPYVEEDDELRKRITSHLMAGDQVVLIDNVPGGGKVGWPSLDAALTSETWQDRELGKNSVARLPMDALWMVTGNNLEVGADATRRTLRCRLEAVDEKPEERTGFRHPKLAEWVREHRTRLLGCAFTILRGYIVAGRPGMSLIPMGSFDGWSDLVRASIVWAGQPDPCGARVASEDGFDQDADAHAAILAGWGKLLDATGDGLTCAQLVAQIRDSQEVFAPMIDALCQVCLTRDGQLPTPTAIGKALRKYDGRVRGGLRLRRRKLHGTTKGWVEKVQGGGGRGQVGSLTPFAHDCQTIIPTGGPAPHPTPPNPTPDDNGDDEVPF